MNGFAQQSSPEVTAEEYGLDVDFDFRTRGDLRSGAVAATVKTQGLERTELEDYEDFLEADQLIVEDGELYGVEYEDQIGFVKDRKVYQALDGLTREHVDLHEAQHYLQYREDERWGDVLDDEHNLSDELVDQLNHVDRLMDLAEHPLYRHTVNEAEVTALVEGYTERITQALQGEDFEEFYPGYTQVAEHLMQQEGIDPEEEFT